MCANILFFAQIHAENIGEVGGKGANLGDLFSAGFPVPDGFCVTTFAYQSIIESSSEMEALLKECTKVNANNLDDIKDIGKRIRDHMESLAIPSTLQKEIINAWKSIGDNYTYAVRSSATAEDLPSASFAGQQDTYLNIRGEQSLLDAIRKCWASLFTDRAIAYRARNGFDHRQVYLSVVIQRMVHPEISGILFTADPVSGNRLVTSIDASFGLGEALVSGLVTADLYKVKHGEVISKKISTKKIMIESLEDGGTKQSDIPEEKQNQQVLSDTQILSLADLGSRIEQHFGFPQDIEFCVEDGKFFVVQSRPITSLYPMPKIESETLRVFLSFGHIQMMTEPMKPLGISIFQTLFPFGKEQASTTSKYILPAGGRLFVDPSDILRYSLVRKIIPKILSNMDNKMSLALQEVIKRPDFTAVPPSKEIGKAVRKNISPVVKEVYQNIFRRDPFLAKNRVEIYIQEQHTEWKESLTGLEGYEQLVKMQKLLSTSLLSIFQYLFPFIAPFLLTAGLLKKYLHDWVQDDQALQKLSQSYDGNITSEMGLAIGDLADQLRILPDVVQYLQTADDSTFFTGLDKIEGGKQFQQVFHDFIEKFGQRCPGEIDITNPRWREKPTLLVPAILGHMRSVKTGEHRRKFQSGAEQAKETEIRVLQQLKRHPIRYRIMKRLIKLYRNLGALREHHKYFLITLLDECKKVIMKQADDLVVKKVIMDREDVYYLSLPEIIQLVKGEEIEDLSQTIKNRKEAFIMQQKWTPSRVMTSEGETVTPRSKLENLPKNALVGTPVSAGVVQGKARIVYKPEEAQLHEGEILVAPFTDPGWTPLFQSAIALVTEVGGLMTHGSVVAREYGIPAVVGVEDALKKIKDGQIIRVDGTQGFVEFVE
ncbi:phosphoenolpyruvate synthase [Shimazuella sp. AN120528]|uniref:phosphoenolpyruvate synthase n=1 Tax=Shimazuella soli TaxID=1892854 RepID=UPI001F0DF34E|nr:phosphoenolpyruvate synthase [Shimazuella soli]MCH5586404.1 phosphoenolpyruvate synthase [Shimazuella soli]